MTHPNHVVYNDVLSIQVLMKEKSGDPTPLNDIIQKFADKVLEEMNSYELVLLKDLACCVIEYLGEEITANFMKRFSPKIIYLVRHPKPQYVSLMKCVEKERTLKRIPEEILEDYPTMERYEKVWNFYKKYPGKIIIAEDLQTEPLKTFKEVYDYMGLEFNEDYLKFEPLKTKKIPENMQYWDLWYENCLSSTEFKVGVTDIDSIKIEDEGVSKRIEKEIKFYDMFIDERKRQQNEKLFMN